ncbi:MAG: chorismate lyase [Propionivibrio sp.]
MTLKQRLAWRKKPVRNAASLPFVNWLCDRDSLTARLQARGVFAVRVLRQGLGVPTLDEAVALGIPRKRIAWIREVALYCDGEPVVFAHTVLPYRPRGPMTQWLARLGNRSLGALLFSHAGFVRGPLSSRRIDRRDALFAPAIAAMKLAPGNHATATNAETAPIVLWARRSGFSFGRQAVLVTEVFSPALAEQPANKTNTK